MVFDVLFFIVFAYAIYIGFTKGLIIQVASLLALILGILGAIKFSGYVSVYLIQKFSMTGEYMPIISFALTFVIIVILVHLTARVTEKLVEAVALGFVNRLLGVLFSLLKYAFIISVVLGLMNGINRRAPFLPEKQLRESHLYKPLSLLAPVIFPYLHFDLVLPDHKPDEPPSEIRV